MLDVYVLASRYEGLPLAVVEAMLASRPVVATDVGSVSEAITDGETGLLVPPDDAAALARAVRSLLDDPAGRRRWARRHGLAPWRASARRRWRAVRGAVRRGAALSGTLARVDARFLLPRPVERAAVLGDVPGWREGLEAAG